jgi:hypothetical protein
MIFKMKISYRPAFNYLTDLTIYNIGIAVKRLCSLGHLVSYSGCMLPNSSSPHSLTTSSVPFSSFLQQATQVHPLPRSLPTSKCILRRIQARSLRLWLLYSFPLNPLLFQSFVNNNRAYLF